MLLGGDLGPTWSHAYFSLLAGRPTAEYERILFDRDPIARYSVHALLNFSRPGRSLLLLAPLARHAGGLATCAGSFGDRTDPDYQALLAAIRGGQALLDRQPRYGTPGFQPNPQYVRELKRFGVLPAGWEADRTPLDGFLNDQAYWRALWVAPAGRSHSPTR